MRTFGERLAELREARGLTQAGLAQLVGLDPTTISKMENGRVKPRQTTVLALAACLGEEAESLLAAAGLKVGQAPWQELGYQAYGSPRRPASEERPSSIDESSLSSDRDDINKRIAELGDSGVKLLREILDDKKKGDLERLVDARVILSFLAWLRFSAGDALQGELLKVPPTKRG